MRKRSLEGRVFGRWTVVRFHQRRKSNDYYVCRCACGTVRDVAVSNLTSGRSQGCSQCADFGKRTDRKLDPRLYAYWRRRKQGKPWRAAWDDFATFYADVSPRTDTFLVQRVPHLPIGPKNYCWRATRARPLSKGKARYLRASGRDYKKRASRINDVYSEGATCQQIADALGISRQRVDQILLQQWKETRKGRG